ncbi:MAG: DUF2974 domain-containing protein [Lachnospiraceae bacterium]|nr:DUF2974 domain-containing protein [Lachnospiraceae bacterium]MBQ9234144.1 DUF2974 domain-containing protein [Lachnospiraceae bacterium]
MANFMDYLDWRGDLSFEAAPINQVDNLILSELSYLKLDDIVPMHGDDKGVISMYHVWKDYIYLGCDQSNLSYDPAPLLEKAAHTERFKNVMLKDYLNVFDTDSHIQFAAVSFYLEDNLIYIAFRGTDGTIEGWREDFNISYMREVPGQMEAVSYVNEVAKDFKGKIILGGHSKGGNLAVYAGAFCSENVKDKIIKIYSNDGPGFNREIAKTNEYNAVLDKVEMIIPEASLVGILMSNKKERLVVKSDASGTMQHSPYSWQVLGDKFELAAKQNTASLMADDTLNNWLDSLDEDELEKFVNALFDILDASGATTLSELSDNKWAAFNAMVKAAKDMDKDTRDNLIMVVKRLADSGRDVIWNEAKSAFDADNDK